MTSYELDEVRAGSPTRHNTSTLESQSNTRNTPHNSTSRQNSSQPGAASPASISAPEDRSFRSLRRKLFQYLFGKKAHDWWARNPVERALLAASKRDRWFSSTYIQTRDLTNAHLNTLFALQLSLPPSASNQTARIGRLPILAKHSLGDCLDELHRVVQVDYPDSFIVCSFAAENPTSRATLLHKLTLILPSRVQRLRKLPRRALVYLLSQEPNWSLSDNLVEAFCEALEPEAPGRSFRLPSEEAPQSAESGINPETSEFVLRWQSDVPKYSGDLDTYIWQRFRRPPSFAWIRIVIIDIDNLRNLRLLLLYKKSRSLEGFCSKIEAGKVYDGTSNPWTPTIAMMDTLSITFGVFLSDMIVFLREASKQISEMVFQSRAHPRAEKIQYLIHLDDCTRRAELDMKSNLIQLKSITQCLQRVTPREPSSNASPVGEQPPHDESSHNLSFVDNSEAIPRLEIDVEYVLKELEQIRGDIKDIRAEIESQNSLKSRNTTMLTFLAAVYVPLAFVTSFLGMNITEFSTPFSKGSNATNSSSASSSSANASSSQGGPNPQLWDMNAFGFLSGPLLIVTIILPVIMGPITRWLLQTYITLKRFWRLIYVFVGVAIITLYYTPDTGAIGLGLCDGSILGIAVMRAIYRLREGNNIALDICFSLLMSALYTLDFIFVTHFPLGLLGWAILLWRLGKGTTFVI